MRIAAAIAPLAFLGPLATAFSLGGNEQAPLEDSLVVPGKNPLVYCAQPDNYILEIENVDLSPNPPQAGKNLTITATGTLLEDVEKGAMAHIEVKMGIVRILTLTLDVCDQADNVDLECPLKKGPLNLTKVVSLPDAIPHATFNVLADVLTKDEDKITCLTAKVAFT